jgi:integrase
MLQLHQPVEAESGLSTGAYLTQWLSFVKTRTRPTTYEGYASLVRWHALPTLGPIPLSSLHPLDLQGLYSALLERGPGERALSTGSVLNLHLVLTQALGQAVRWQLLGSNPAGGARPPRAVRPEQVVVDPAMARRILGLLVGTDVEVPATVALGTGMRRGEILALRWSDLDPDFTVAQVRRTVQPTAGGLVFHEPKTPRSRRAVALPSFLAPVLTRHRRGQDRRRTLSQGGWEDTDLVVDRGDGRVVNPDTLSSAWRRFLRVSGLPHVRFHDLRHAHATLLLAKGVHPKVVSERLGHASVGITLDIYSHVLPTMQTEAARALDEVVAAPP